MLILLTKHSSVTYAKFKIIPVSWLIPYATKRISQNAIELHTPQHNMSFCLYMVQIVYIKTDQNLFSKSIRETQYELEN